MAEPIFITCLSLISPVGLTPESAAAAIRAGINGFVELSYRDDGGQPIVGAVVPGLSDNFYGRARLVALLTCAFEAAQARLPLGLELERLPLILCTCEPQRVGASVEGIVADVERYLEFAFPRDSSTHLASGHIAGFEALQSARRLFGEHRAEACLIATVESLCNAPTLLWLERAGRLKTLMQADGVIPGEAACVTLVTRRAVTSSPVAILGLGFAVEQATVLNDEPLRAKGLTSAVRAALAEAGMAMHDISLRTSDVAGESYAFEELSLTLSQVLRRRVNESPLWHPADCVGDTGACAGLIQFAIAEQAFARGYAPGPRVLCHGGAASGSRTAAVLSITQNSRGTRN